LDNSAAGQTQSNGNHDVFRPLYRSALCRRVSRAGDSANTSWTREGNKNDYLYNAGNELNSNSQWYETFFRGYDPALGKFLQVDPMADKYASATTYNYAFNNPVVMNDPMGDDPNNPARGFQWWRYNQNGTPCDKGMQDAHAGGMAQQGRMYGSGYASSKSLSSLVNYLLNHTTDGGTWQNGSYRIFASSAEAYSSTVGSDGPQIYNYFCSCMVNAFDVLATNPANQNKNFRAWAQAAVNIYNTRAQLNSIGIAIQQGTQGSGPDFTKSNWALEIGGGLFGTMEGTAASQGYWLGKNGKYYPERWGGNQYTGSRAGVFKAANMYKWAGRGTVALTAVIGGIQTYNGYQMDGGQFGYNAQSAAAQTIGGIGGGMGGAVLGAEIGAGIGVWFGGVGAVPGAIIGGIVGGVVGGWGGSSLGEGAVNLYHGR
jgi:RHS repeat-associated protein